jgi:hypothetical protein
MESLLQYRILMLLPQKQVLLREETANIIFSHISSLPSNFTQECNESITQRAMVMVIWTGNQYNNTAYSCVNSFANFMPWRLTTSLQL